MAPCVIGNTETREKAKRNLQIMRIPIATRSIIIQDGIFFPLSWEPGQSYSHRLA